MSFNPDFLEERKQAALLRQQKSQSKLTSEVPEAGASLKKPKFRAGAFAMGAGIDTFMNMRAGDDFGTAAVKGAFSGMLWTAMPGVMTAVSVAEMGPALFNGYQNWMREKESWFNRQSLPNFGGNYQDTRRALTMRQSAVEAIQGSKLNARSALGGEAKLIAQNMHRG